jgi:hypothetical protein
MPEDSDYSTPREAQAALGLEPINAQIRALRAQILLLSVLITGQPLNPDVTARLQALAAGDLELPEPAPSAGSAAPAEGR